MVVTVDYRTPDVQSAAISSTALDAVRLVGTGGPAVRTAGGGWTFRRAARFQWKKYGLLLSRTGRTVAKRALDVAVALALLIALAPLFALVALLIKATDGGSVFFCQTRVGKRGRELRFPKFRSL